MRLRDAIGLGGIVRAAVSRLAGRRVERARSDAENALRAQQRVASLRAAQRRDLYGGIRYGCRVGQARRRGA